MNATHLKIYRKSSSVGNGIIYMVRRDTESSPEEIDARACRLIRRF